jgi:hypothetical protein
MMCGQHVRDVAVSIGLDEEHQACGRAGCSSLADEQRVVRVARDRAGCQRQSDAAEDFPQDRRGALPVPHPVVPYANAFVVRRCSKSVSLRLPPDLHLTKDTLLRSAFRLAALSPPPMFLTILSAGHLITSM